MTDRLVFWGEGGILRLSQQPPILAGYWRAAKGCGFDRLEMRRGLQSLGFSFEAESLTHFGGLFLIQRFCNKLCLRRRLERILKDAPQWADYPRLI